MKSGSSAPIGSGGQSAATPAAASSSQTSRPGVQGTSAPVRRTTSWRRPSSPAVALSALAFKGVRRPPRGASSAVTSSLAPESSRRERSASAEKPAKTTECTAPIRAQASIA